LAEEKKQANWIDYAILGLVVISLIVSAVSLVTVPEVPVPENIATKDDVTGLATKDDVTGLKEEVSALKEAVEELGVAPTTTPPTGEVVVEGISVPLGEAGAPTNIEVTFRNPGAEAGTGEFTLTVAGEVVEVLEPVVDPYSVSTLMVPVTKAKGNYKVNINGFEDLLVVVGSPPDQYEKAAMDEAEITARKSSQTEEHIMKEYVWFAHASEPYRGLTLRTIIEDVAYAWPERDWLVPKFKEITGITVDMRITDSVTTTKETAKELETKTGAYDFISVDTDTNPMLGRRGGIRHIGEIMTMYPDITNPWLDFGDFVHGTLVSHLYTGEFTGIVQSTGLGGFAYLYDWFTDEAKAEFEAEYGYEMVDPYYLSREEWTWDRCRDYMEFFTQPDEGKYGFISWGKTVDMLAWWYWERNAHCVGAISQFVEYPEIELGPERDDLSYERLMQGESTLWLTRPYGYPLPVGYAVGVQQDEPGGTPAQYYGTEPVGALVEHGGNVNGPEMCYMHDWMVEAYHEFSSEAVWESDPVAAIITEFSTGAYWSTGNDWVGHLVGTWWIQPEIKDSFRVCPVPVSEYWREGMPTEHDDLSNWTIFEGSKNPEAAWLYLQWSQSKSNALKKVLDWGIGAVRRSTMEAMLTLPDADEWNEKFGKLWDMYLTDYHYSQHCTEPMCFDRPGYLDACYPVLAEGLRSKWSGEKTMTQVAENIEDLLDELGIMRADLRQYVEREPWRED
jgi:glycerol transport system substrate-binding protein